MNKNVSTYKSFINGMIFYLLAICSLLVFTVLSFSIFGVSIILILSFLFISFCYMKIFPYDIEIHNQSIILRSIYKELELDKNGTFINNIKINKGPVFVIYSSNGTFAINFTKKNMDQIVDLLNIQKKDQGYINKFIFDSKSYIIPLKT